MTSVNVRAVAPEEKPVLKWLLELYVTELSQIKGASVPEKKMFIDGDYLDLFWNQPRWAALLITYHEKAAGFALVSSGGLIFLDEIARSISEFFILKKYRRQGIGREAARMLFDRLPGKWEILQSEYNLPGQAFWRSVLSEYTGGGYTESFLQTPVWTGPIQVFDNSTAA